MSTSTLSRRLDALLVWHEAVRTPVARPADGRALVLSLAVGLSCDLAVRAGVVVVAGSVAVTTAAIALVASALRS